MPHNKSAFSFFFGILMALCLCAADKKENAYETVRSASHFAIGGVGVAGTVTVQEIAMHELRDGPQAEAQLRKLLREATPAGQMYALFALRQLNSRDYTTLSAPYRQSSTPVPTISGCIIHTQRMSEAVRWIDQYAQKIRSWEKSGATPKQPLGLARSESQVDPSWRSLGFFKEQ